MGMINPIPNQILWGHNSSRLKTSRHVSRGFFPDIDAKNWCLNDLNLQKEIKKWFKSQ
jgi:hypothetical protein